MESCGCQPFNGDSGKWHKIKSLQSAALLAILSGPLVACSVSNQDQYTEAKQQESPRKFSAVSGPDTPLAFEFEVRGDPTSPIIAGATNLPDGTHISANVLKGDRYLSDGGKAEVANGNFETPPLKLNNDPLLPGKYILEIMTPLEAVQPDQVRAAVGREYENLTGNQFSDGEFGRVITITRPYIVPGAPNRAAEAARDEKVHQEVREHLRRECANAEYSAGRPTRTPKAQRRIEACLEKSEAEVF